jgi:propanediol dehydratase large subunit
VTDPNDYQGPGTGYEVTAARRTEMAGIRQQRSKDDLLRKQATREDHVRLVKLGEAQPGSDPHEVCVGVSPALATKLWVTMSGLPVGEVLHEIVAGLADEGCTARLVRVPSTVDLGMIGLTAAQLAGRSASVFRRRGRSSSTAATFLRWPASSSTRSLRHLEEMYRAWAQTPVAMRRA